jgi:DNA/RNA-binding domain of Phe-tRNA-synthetase-like protein
MSDVASLAISPEVSELGIVATHLVVEELSNRRSDPDFDRLREQVFASLAARYTRGFLKRDEVLAGYRAVRRALGGDALDFPCSTEWLVREIRRSGELPSINLAVDIYNLVAAETRLTLGAHDLDRVEGRISLVRAMGGERFFPLGGGSPQSLSRGEFCYVDASGDVLCRMDYKQSEKTKLTEGTSRALFIVQGNPNTPLGSVDEARTRLHALLGRYCSQGGQDDGDTQ